MLIKIFKSCEVFGDFSRLSIRKIDVEGYEQKVFAGASGLLKRNRVKYIMSEVTFGRQGQKDYIRMLLDLGYRISIVDFEGPFLQFENGNEMQAFDGKQEVFNIFASKR